MVLACVCSSRDGVTRPEGFASSRQTSPHCRGLPDAVDSSSESRVATSALPQWRVESWCQIVLRWFVSSRGSDTRQTARVLSAAFYRWTRSSASTHVPHCYQQSNVTSTTWHDAVLTACYNCSLIVAEVLWQSYILLDNVHYGYRYVAFFDHLHFTANNIARDKNCTDFLWHR